MIGLYTKIPLRLGLLGGGSDLPAFCNLEKGYILNCAISLYNHIILYVEESNTFELCVVNENHKESILVTDPNLIEFTDTKFTRFVPVVLMYIVNTYGVEISKSRFLVNLRSDVEAGSGLGGSSSMIAGIIETFNVHFNLKLTKNLLCKTAFDIERNLLGIVGGSQDYYASVFGKFNLMEFDKDEVFVESLNIDESFISLLESSLLMFYTGIRREAKIIEAEKSGLVSEIARFTAMLDGANLAKDTAIELKNKPSIVMLSDAINSAWSLKKMSSEKVTNEVIEEILLLGMANGAFCGKISGAGSGGYGFFIVPVGKLNLLREKLSESNFVTNQILFDFKGVNTLKI